MMTTEHEGMAVSMKMSVRANIALRVLRSTTGRRTFSDALLAYIEEHSPDLVTEIDELTEKQLSIMNATRPNRMDTP